MVEPPNPSAIAVQVCHASGNMMFLVDLRVTPGTTLEQAVVQSGLLELVPGIDLASAPVGIFSKKKPRDTVLRAHDRVEVYLPLVADPKQSRRTRAEKKNAG